MKTWNMIIDVAKCSDCNNCFIACKDEFFDNDFPPFSVAQPKHGHRWINIFSKERGQHPRVDVAYLAMPCMHCTDAPCQKKGEGAVYRREDGIMIIDPAKAKGKKGIVEACPYGAIYWNEERQVAQKCTFCAHLLDQGWSQPRCAQACPTGAITVHQVEPEEMDRIKNAERLETFKPQLKTGPRVFYKNLYRFERAFIAGGVVYKGDCAEGAKVTLTNDPTHESMTATTDNYGDFKFDNLLPGSYTLKIEHPGCKPRTRGVALETSLNLGEFDLDQG